jgi:hypothetical protein
MITKERRLGGANASVLLSFVSEIKSCTISSAISRGTLNPSMTCERGSMEDKSAGRSWGYDEATCFESDVTA